MTDTFGITTIKQWVSTADARTRSAHAQMNGTKVSMDEDFMMPNGTRMGFVGDPRGGAANVVNCRCVIIYAEAEDVIEDSEPLSNKIDAKEVSVRTLIDDIPEADIERIVSGNIRGFTRGDPKLDALIRARKFDGLPELVDRDAFDSIP